MGDGVDDFNPDDQSVFNMGIAILYRIDKILTQIAMSKMTGDGKSLYSALFALKGEIYYQLKEPERTEIDKLFKDILPHVSFGLKREKGGGSFITPAMSALFESIETKLKEYFHKRGMLGATKRDPRYALSQGF